MNIFIIPSWYPSPQHPYTGIFFREQAEVYASYNPKDNVGISLWGQNDERFLLWGKDHLKNFAKIYRKKYMPKSRNNLSDNCVEYFNPGFTWTLKIGGGNIEKIIKKNVENLSFFEKERGKADIILTQVGYPAGFIGRAISIKRNIPFVIMEHMSPFPFKYYIRSNGKLLEKLNQAYHSASELIAVSNSLSTKMKKFRLKNPKVVNNFIDDSQFSLPFKGQKKASLKLLLVGRLVYQKGVDILFKALHQLKGLDFFVEVIGSGNEEVNLRKLAIQIDIQDKIIWHGEQPKEEIIGALHRCDFFVLPSRHESFGITFLEALACGKPCIGTICGGPEEIISEEVGIIVEKENPKALAEAIQFMSKNLDKYPPEKIRKYYDQNFSAEKTVKKLRNLFEDVIDLHLNPASASSN